MKRGTSNAGTMGVAEEGIIDVPTFLQFSLEMLPAWLLVQ